MFSSVPPPTQCVQRQGAVQCGRLLQTCRAGHTSKHLYSISVLPYNPLGLDTIPGGDLPWACPSGGGGYGAILAHSDAWSHRSPSLDS